MRHDRQKCPLGRWTSGERCQLEVGVASAQVGSDALAHGEQAEKKPRWPWIEISEALAFSRRAHEESLFLTMEAAELRESVLSLSGEPFEDMSAGGVPVPCGGEDRVKGSPRRVL